LETAIASRTFVSRADRRAIVDGLGLVSQAEEDAAIAAVKDLMRRNAAGRQAEVEASDPATLSGLLLAWSGGDRWTAHGPNGREPMTGTRAACEAHLADSGWMTEAAQGSGAAIYRLSDEVLSRTFGCWPTDWPTAKMTAEDLAGEALSAKTIERLGRLIASERRRDSSAKPGAAAYLALAKALGGVVAWNDNGRQIAGAREPLECHPTRFWFKAEAAEADNMAALVHASWPEVGEGHDWQNTCTRGYDFSAPEWTLISAADRPAAERLWERLEAAGWVPGQAQR
jgi:hypothetical protein